MSLYESPCRLCAGMKSTGKVINVDGDNDKQNDIVMKLLRLNARAEHLFSGDTLPKSVCLVCLNLLDSAYTFVENFERAQIALNSFHNRVKKEQSEDDQHECTELVPPQTEVLVKSEPTEKIIRKSEKKTLKSNSLSWQDYNWVCAKCGIEFPNISDFKTHSMQLHNCCNAFKCTDCNKKMLRLDKFVLHVKRHRKYLKLSCYMCHSKFSSAHKVSIHKKIHLVSEHICSGCNTSFKSTEELNNHVKMYYKNCSGSSIAITDLTDGLTCAVCKKTFKNKGSLNGHLLVHVERGPKERIHICDRCGKGYFNKTDLAYHVVTHTDARPFQCDICQSDFKTKIRLKAHLKVHTGIKPFSCEQCGRQFRLKKQLRSHEIIHTDSLPFSCPYCIKAFRFKSVLDLHIRQHTGVKPYLCELCQRNFTNWSNYNKHMKRRHGMNMVKKKLNLSQPKVTVPFQ